MKRIILSFLIALLGIAGSWVYLRPKEWTTSSSSKHTVARVVETNNEVSRQEEGRLLWSPLRKGDSVFLGDKIKTSGLSSTIIELHESKSKLEIEENSMIVMSQGAKKLALNMLEGRVFLKQEEATKDQQLDIISGGKTLDLKGDVAVSVGKDGASHVDSFKNESSESAFQELKPNYGEEIYSSKGDIVFQWKPKELPGVIEVEAGESPTQLKKVKVTEASLKSGKLTALLSSGVTYWRLILKNETASSKSPLMKVNITRPVAPQPLSPSQGEILKPSDRGIDLKWVRGNGKDEVTVEVSRDSSFSDTVESANVKDQTFYTLTKTLAQGDYYWRLKSTFPGSSEMFVSKPISFKVFQGKSLPSPIPQLPEQEAIHYLQKGAAVPVNFRWKKQSNVRGYELTISGPQFSKITQVTEASVLIPIQNVGKYIWSVTSEGEDGKKSDLPATRNFSVRDFATLIWKTNQKTYSFTDAFPIVLLQWERSPYNAYSLKVSMNQDMSSAEVYQTNGLDYPYRPSKEGIHYAKVSSYDEYRNVSGESEVFEFEVTKAAVPPAPKYELAEENIKTGPKGNFEIKLVNHKTPWTVLTQVMDDKGSVVLSKRFGAPLISFSSLKPGTYFLQARYDDEHKRSSVFGDRIEVIVPEKSMIAPPKIKGIKVR